MFIVNEQEIENKKQQSSTNQTDNDVLCTAISLWYRCLILIVMITGVPTIQSMLAMYHSSNIDMPVVNQNFMHRF